MPSLFRRRTATAEQPSDSSVAGPDNAGPDNASHDNAEPDSAEPGDTSSPTSQDAESAGPRAGVKPKAYTPGKGRPTPKRRDARRRSAEPPPKDRKEARRRMREERMEARAAMMRGDEKYLQPRDKGPERALARNIVDARRNVGTWFFAGAVVILIGTWPGVFPPQVRAAFDLFWVVLLVAVIVDSFLLSRLVRRLVKERYPKTTQRPTGLYFYAIMRALTLRRMRIPAPQVKPGDAI